MWSTGELREWVVPLHSMEDPWEGRILPDTAGAGQQRSHGLPSIPLPARNCCTACPPTFPKGKQCPFLLPVSRETAAGKALEVLELAGMPSPPSCSGSPGFPSAPVCIPPIRGQRDPWEQLLPVCPAQHYCVAASWAQGMVLWELTLSQVPPWGHRASLLWGIRAGEGCEVMVGAVLLCQCPLSPLPWGGCPQELLGEGCWDGGAQPSLGNVAALISSVPCPQCHRELRSLRCNFHSGSQNPSRMEISRRERMVVNIHGFARLP